MDDVEQDGSVSRKAHGETSTSTGGVGTRLLKGIREIVLILLLALVISAVIRAFVGQLFVIPSGSMEQTIEPGDRVAAIKPADFKRGDIVVFKDSGHWLGANPPKRSAAGQFGEFVGVLPNTSSNYLIKRVIGMPGDTVSCCGPKGRMSVNGKPLDENSYLYRTNGVPVEPSQMRFEVRVPRDRIFVMGDHRDASGDSRCHLSDPAPGAYRGASAFIPIDDVVGPAKFTVSPLSRMTHFSTPETFDGIADRSASAPEKADITLHDAGCS